MKIMITGVRPTGSITLANYIGGIRGFIEQQHKYNSLIFIADIHGLTTYINPKEIRNNILDITAMYMACGIDTNNTALFMQSDVLEHCNLGFLMSFQCSVGELSRMTQFKSKRQQLGKSEKDMGLFIYPTLMAADILLYDAEIVPVGADQRQHIEKTRDFGERFNNIYGNIFKLPEYQIPKIGAKIMNLQDPSIKMSKSAPKDDKGTIFMLDDIEITRKKITTNPVVAEKLENNIGYLEVSSFDENTAENFKAKYEELKSQGITSLVIDLRNNGGGLVEEALKIADYIVPKDKELLVTVDKDGKEKVEKSKEDVLIDMPIVVLVNKNSASSSEILAGALKDLNEATIVGNTTYGKGVIQQLIQLRDGAGLKVTVEEYYTPNRTKINGVGIEPNEKVDLPESVENPLSVERKDDTQLQKAMEILNK